MPPTTLPLFEIRPGEGAGPLRFGMKRSEARAAMKAAGLALSDTSEHGLDWFGEENGVQVDYVDDTVSYVGLSGCPDFDCRLYGVDPFDLEGRALFSLIATKSSEPKAKFDENEYLFRTTIVALWGCEEQYDRKGVATDAQVIQIHRDHRDPEIQSVPLGRFSALTDSAEVAQGRCARG